MSAPDEVRQLADRLDELCRWHTQECGEMHGADGMDLHGPECCFHSASAWDAWAAAVALRHHANLLDSISEHPTEPPSIAARHQAHYRYCECVGDSSECCDATCPCHDEPPPAPTTCPECGSDDPAVQRPRGPGQRHCPDPWHQAAT